jgi:hypothetical protein
MIFEQMRVMLARSGQTLVEYLYKYEMHPKTCRMPTPLLITSITDLDIELNKEEKAAIELLVDPQNSGHADMSKMVREEATRGIKMNTLKP